MGRKGRSRSTAPSIEDLVEGRVRGTASDLLVAIRRLNPTGLKLPRVEMLRRYAQKSRLQSFLITRYPEDLLVRREEHDPDLVALGLRGFVMDACHARISGLDADAAAHVEALLADGAHAQASPGVPQSLSVALAEARDAGADRGAAPRGARAQDADDRLAAGWRALEAFDLHEARDHFEAAFRESDGGPEEAEALLGLLVDHLGAFLTARLLEPRLGRAALERERVRRHLAVAEAWIGELAAAERRLDALTVEHRWEVAGVVVARALDGGDLERARRLLRMVLAGAPGSTGRLTLEARLHALEAERIAEADAAVRAALSRDDAEAIERAAAALQVLAPDAPILVRVREVCAAARRAQAAQARLGQARERLATGDLEEAARLALEARGLGAVGPELEGLLGEARQRVAALRALEQEGAALARLLGEDPHGLALWAGLPADARARVRAEVGAVAPGVEADLDLLEALPLPASGRRLDGVVEAIHALRRAEREVEAGRFQAALGSLRRCGVLPPSARLATARQAVEAGIALERAREVEARLAELEASAERDGDACALLETLSRVPTTDLSDAHQARAAALRSGLEQRAVDEARLWGMERALQAGRNLAVVRDLRRDAPPGSPALARRWRAVAERAEAGLRTLHRPLGAEAPPGTRLTELRVGDGLDRALLRALPGGGVAAAWSAEGYLFAAHLRDDGEVIRVRSHRILPSPDPRLRGKALEACALWERDGRLEVVGSSGIVVVLDARDLQLLDIRPAPVSRGHRFVGPAWATADATGVWGLCEPLTDIPEVMRLDRVRGRAPLSFKGFVSVRPVSRGGLERVVLCSETEVHLLDPAGERLDAWSGSRSGMPRAICVTPHGIAGVFSSTDGLTVGLLPAPGQGDVPGSTLFSGEAERVELEAAGDRLVVLLQVSGRVQVRVISLAIAGMVLHREYALPGGTLVPTPRGCLLAVEGERGLELVDATTVSAAFLETIPEVPGAPRSHTPSLSRLLEQVPATLAATWAALPGASASLGEDPGVEDALRRVGLARRLCGMGQANKAVHALLSDGGSDPVRPIFWLMSAEVALYDGRLHIARAAIENIPSDYFPEPLRSHVAFLAAALLYAEGQVDVARARWRDGCGISALAASALALVDGDPGPSAEVRAVLQVMPALRALRAAVEADDGVPAAEVDLESLWRLWDANVRAWQGAAWVRVAPETPWEAHLRRRAIAAAADAQRRALDRQSRWRFERLPLPGAAMDPALSRRLMARITAELESMDEWTPRDAGDIAPSPGILEREEAQGSEESAGGAHAPARANSVA